MLARIVKDAQDNLTWERITSSVVGSTPLGAVYGIWSNTVPEGFLPCNGAQFDRTQYPFLYTMLGTDYLPDLRECTLVGIGENGTDTLTTHDIYTLGQFKDFSTAGSGSIKTAGYTVSGNNVVLNSTVNASNRKLVTQYVADADATDLQTLDIGGASITRMRSKGVNYIIKAVPGNEVGDYNYVIDQMEAQLALKINLEYVNALPTGDDIEDNIYGYNGHYYIGDKEHATLTQFANNSDLTALQPKTLDTSLTIGGQTITTVEDALSALNTVKIEKGINDVNALPVSPNIEDLIYRYNGDIYFGDSTNQTTTLLDAEAIVMVDESDPLPTGASIKAKLYVQPETIGSSTKYHYYVGDTTATPHVLIEMSTGGSDIFVGTQAEWNNLSAAEQAQYTQANITDVNSVVHVPVDAVADGNMNPVTSNAVYDRLAYRVIPTGVSIDELIGSEYVGTYKVTTSTYMPYVCGSQLSSGTLVVAFDGTSTVQTILGDGYTARRVHNGTSWKNYSTSNNDNISTEQYPYGWRVTYGQSYNGEYIFYNGWNDVLCLLSIASGIPVVHLVGSNNTPDIVGNGYVVFPRESLANALWRFGMNPTSFARWYWTCSGTFDNGNVQLFAGAYSSFTNPFFVRSNSSLSGTRVNLCFIPWMIN